ncbi:MAG: L,D-transpeptidase [Acidobacteriota bacterium]|nr:L,D-transpeptidase [Acidobacteriota bacterium]
MIRSVAARLLLVLVAALALGAASAPAGALAAGTPVTATPVRLTLTGLFAVHHDKVTVPERAVVISGTVAHYVPRQRVALVASVAGRVVLRRTLSVARRGGRGHFQTTLHVPRVGHVRVALTHVRNTRMLSFATATSYTVLDNTVAPGATGRYVQLVQQRLAALHFFIPQTGVYDQGTELALDAYNRLLGKGEGHLTLDPATATDLLGGVGSFHVRYPNQGSHVEGDLSDQVLALTDGSQVHWLFPISSGKPSTPTILGNFRVYYKQPGYLPDGMYYSDFFIGGYAVHGYDPAPDYPASHGCMRLPIVDAIPAYDWIKMGDWVDTYYT